nr:hypothetical protein [Bacteroidota bacterium]
MAYVFVDFPFNSYIGPMELLSINTNLNLGVGYNYKNKYSAEVRYGTRREILRGYQYYTGIYQSVSIMFGFNVF